MAITENQLNHAVSERNRFGVRLFQATDTKSLLKGKDLASLKAPGVWNAHDLVDQLVTWQVGRCFGMDYLCELILESLGPVKIYDEQKEAPGYKGFDFISFTPHEIRLIRLDAASGTRSGPWPKTRRDLADAASYWETEAKSADDGPQAVGQEDIVRIWAVPRGPSLMSRPDQVLRLRGDPMWEYFGSGPGFWDRIDAATATIGIPNPYCTDIVDGLKAELRGFLKSQGHVRPGGGVNWTSLLSAYP